jgi:hypothetical protein
MMWRWFLMGILLGLPSFPLFAQNPSPNLRAALQHTRSSNQGSHNFYVNFIGIRDSRALFPDQRSHGLYPTFGYEYQEINYNQWEGRIRMRCEILNEVTYYLLGWLVHERIEDFDDRYSLTSYFSGGLMELMASWNIITTDRLTIGLGGVLYDLVYQHRNINAEGQQEPKDFSDFNGWGGYGGWVLHSDVLLASSLTLHVDFLRGYGLYHAKKERLEVLGYPGNPFGSWQLTAMLLHQSGAFVNFRWHQVIARTDFPTQAARIQFGLGYRFGMYRYKGESHRRDPRRNANKVTF